MYTLRGFLSFNPASTAFLIPCFTHTQSNFIFAQELDEEGNIVCFNQIDPSNYIWSPFQPSQLDCDIGGAGIFAVRLSNDEHIYGDYPTMLDRLSCIDLDTKGSPFFNVDVYSFLADASSRDNAIDIASRLFGDGPVSESWRTREKHVNTLGLHRSTPAPKDQAQSILEWLYNHPGSTDWPRNWLKLWSNPPEVDVSDVAFWWLREFGREERAAPVIATLIRAPETQRDAAEIGIRWVNNVPQSSDRWGMVWSAVYRFVTASADRSMGQFFIDPEFEPSVSELEAIGLHFLAEPPWDRFSKTQIKSWCSVWKRLRYHQFEHSDRNILTMPFDHILEFGDNAYFQKHALVPAFTALAKKKNIDAGIIVWLDNFEVTNSWVQIYCSLYEHPYITDTVHEKALDFLKSPEKSLSGWKRLWDTMRRDTDRTSTYDAIAGNWLSKTDSSMRIWPEVLASLLLRHRTDPGLRRLANDWLAGNPVHGKRTLIQLALESR